MPEPMGLEFDEVEMHTDCFILSATVNEKVLFHLYVSPFARRDI
jgi:hypothetical protein